MSASALHSSVARQQAADTRTGQPVLSLASSATPVQARLEDLSPRERDVLRLVTNCYSNQEISESLYLSLNSVKTYIRGAYRKIGAPSRSHAVVWGVRHGLLEPLERGADLTVADGA